MTLADALAAKAWSGQRLAVADADRLQHELGAQLPEWLLDAMRTYPLIGVTLVLDEDGDESGLGVEMKWLDADGIVSEARDAYPGRAAISLGFVPIGSCLLGSGDPYFVRATSDPEESEFVRIPHAAVDENDRLVAEQVETVAARLARFIELAVVE